MNSIVLMIVAAIVVLGPLIAIHEFGHFWVARRVGVKVLTFSIGFGPVLWKRTDKKGTQYQVAAIPLGGFVRMADEREGEVTAQDLPKAFNRQPAWAKMAIVAAGPLINLVFAVFLYWILFLQPAETLRTVVGRVLPSTAAAMAGVKTGDEILAVDGEPVADWEAINYALINRMGESGEIRLQLRSAGAATTHELSLVLNKFLGGRDIDPFRELGFLPWQPLLTPIIGEVLSESAAAKQGLKTGDEVVVANGQRLSSWQELTDIIRAKPNQTFQVDIRRGAQVLTLALTPRGEKDNQGILRGKLGVGPKPQPYEIPPAYRQIQHNGPVAALGLALYKTGKLISFTLDSMVKMVMGKISVDNLSGPITIAKVAGQTAAMGWESLLGFMALLSVSLGVLNLLPVPVLDGGHLVVHGIEGVLGRPLSERVQMVGMRIGIAMLMSLMLLAIFNDLSRL